MSSNKSKPSISYTLFLYRQELRRRDARYLCLNKAKCLLTDELIARGVRNVMNCTTFDLMTITRELLFKKKLKKQLRRIHKLENLGIKNANPNAQTTEL